MLRLIPLLFLLLQPAKPEVQAPSDSLCGQLRAMSDAANRDGSFERLASSGFRPNLLRHCRLNGSNAFMCSQNLAPASVDPAILGPRVAQCLPNGRLEQRQTWPRSGTTFRDGRLAITMNSHCDERCKAGRIASIRFEVEPAPAQGD
jgi:hypothetical protein